MTLLNNIREVFDSNPGKDIDYPESRVYVVFHSPSRQMPG
jgi:hypothetical protein